MRKIFLLTFLLVLSVLSILVISCVTPKNSGERTAVAGLAISKGCYDADNDGYGRSGNSIRACSGSTRLFDCDDSNAAINPRATEICGNRVDDNCNRRVDEKGCVILVLPTPACISRTEICDGVDNDCDSQIDEGCDDDGDRACDGSMITLVEQEPGRCFWAGDCDDENPLRRPFMTEICNGFDDDCNDRVDENADGLLYGACRAVCTETDGGDNPLLGGSITWQFFNEAGDLIVSYKDIDGCSAQWDSSAGISDFHETICTSQWASYGGPYHSVCTRYSPSSYCGDPDSYATGGTRRPTDINPNFEESLGNIPGHCIDPCGNGILDTGEGCDDGNRIETDECTNACRLRFPPACGNGRCERYENDVAYPDYCARDCAVCGNNILETGELCDDGNTTNGDGCTLCRCSDTDSGRLPRTRGTVTTAEGTFRDVCSSEVGYITERFCADDGSLQSEDLECNYGLAADDPYRNEFGTSCETASSAAGCVIIG